MTDVSSSTRLQARADRPTRVTSVIQPDSKYFVTKQERVQGALYFYNNKTKAKRSEWTWASLIVQALWPTASQRDLNRKTWQDMRSVWKTIYDGWSKSGVSVMTSVKKDMEGKRFIVTVPIMIAPIAGFPAGLARLVMLTAGDKNYSTLDEYRVIVNGAEALTQTTREVDLSTVKALGSLSTKDAEYLKLAKARLIAKAVGSYHVAFLELSFTQREVEFLCNSSWLEIRPLDLYGVIRSWVEGYYGMYSRSATFSIPLTRIAKQSEAKNATPRLSVDGLLLDQHGSMYALPASLNSISRYEDAAATAYMQEDGTFSAVSAEGKIQTPPPSMPVYMDWANLKFAYTSLDGKLLIQNLDRSQALNVSHIRQFLSRRMDHDTAKNFLTFTVRLADFFRTIAEASTFIVKLYQEIERKNHVSGQYNSVNEATIQTIYDYAGMENPDGSPSLCQRFVDAAEETRKFIVANPVNAYAKYSVPTITELLAELTVFSKYAPQFGQVVAEDNSKRKAYTSQGEDPKFQMHALPFVKEGMGLLPHQFKLQNLMRDNPDNVILPVDAGGGKTPVILLDTLRQIKDDPNALCLVMCPSHLTKQYVKEFAYFVGNNVNIIPVTSYTIRRHGLDKLKSMILKSPRNTIVLTDFNAIVLKRLTLSYGVAPIQMFPIVEFLRQFHFGYVACDESHWLKNGSSRNAAAARLFVEIPKKRLASGTLVADTIIDLVRQMALIDPSVFGTVEDFVKEYALEVRGSKVVKWKPGAEMRVNAMLRKNVVIAGAKRKEWAAILPRPEEEFHRVSLTEAQFRCYQNILMVVEEEIRRKALEDKRLAALLAGEVDEEDPEMDLNSLLKPYLARLERFLTAPGKDILGEKILSGEDLVSPKVLKIVEICRKHLDQKLPGKILIFTNYQFSAEAIYDGFPADLKDKVIYYTAGNKDIDGAEFERNPEKMIMVGIEQSMNTGLNLQFCSRLIRVETVWSPGVLEQGNSRVGRPNIKVRESRPSVYYDWIACDLTIDVTKISYLMAKTISTAKFYEAGNPRFDDLEVPELMKMTLDTVFAQNDFDTTLVEYFNKYEAFKQAQNAEREEFRENNKEKLFDEEGNIRMAAISRSEDPDGSELQHDSLYQPGLEVDGFKDLGLVRYDDFMKIDPEDLEEDESLGIEDDESDSDEDSEGDDEEAGEMDPKKALRRSMLQAERAKAIGLKVHTDLGDGEIVRVMFKALRIKLKNGTSIRAPKMATFVYTKELKSKVDLRTLLLQNTSKLPIDNPVTLNKSDVPIKKGPKSKVPEAEMEHEETAIEMDLDFTIINDFLGVRLNNMENESAVKAAQAFGFKHPPTYFAAQVKRPMHIRLFFEALAEKGFEIDKENSRACFEAWKHFRANRETGTDFFGVATSNDIRNFYRIEFKPNPNKNHVNPYPLIQDGMLYIALPKNGQPGSIEAMRKARVPGLSWYEFTSDAELVCFTPSKAKASSLIRSLLAEGIVLRDLEELKKKFRKLRLARENTEED